MADGQIWDCLRKKWVANTAEEQVRQSFIAYLHKILQVPLLRMSSEVFLQIGKTGFKKDYRADIVIYDDFHEVLMLVECKRCGQKLNSSVLEQILTYNMYLNAKYIAITNGRESIFCYLDKGRYQYLKKAPLYSEMLENR